MIICDFNDYHLAYLPKFAHKLWPSLYTRCIRPWKWALQTLGSLSKWAHKVTVSCYGRPVRDVQPKHLMWVHTCKVTAYRNSVTLRVTDTIRSY